MFGGGTKILKYLNLDTDEEYNTIWIEASVSLSLQE